MISKKVYLICSHFFNSWNLKVFIIWLLILYLFFFGGGGTFDPSIYFDLLLYPWWFSILLWSWLFGEFLLGPSQLFPSHMNHKLTTQLIIYEGGYIHLLLGIYLQLSPKQPAFLFHFARNGKQPSMTSLNLDLIISQGKFIN